VQATDGFYLIAGHNLGVHGAILTEALASRFKVHLRVPTDWTLARHLGVPHAAIDAAKALNQHLAAGAISWAPYAEAGVMPRSVRPGSLARLRALLGGIMRPRWAAWMA
jgi:hypothetical protein